MVSASIAPHMSPEPAQPISQTLTKIDPTTMSDAELAAIVRNGMQADDRPH